MLSHVHSDLTLRKSYENNQTNCKSQDGIWRDKGALFQIPKPSGGHLSCPRGIIGSASILVAVKPDQVLLRLNIINVIANTSQIYHVCPALLLNYGNRH